MLVPILRVSRYSVLMGYTIQLITRSVDSSLNVYDDGPTSLLSP